MATSKLQIEVGNLLDKTFPEYRIRENYRPDWLMSSNLTKLELDFYIEELKIAFEVQGKQHYEYIPYFFKTIEDFEKRKQYDIEKKDLCYGAGVKLIEIFSMMEAIIEIDNVREKTPEKPKASVTKNKIDKHSPVYKYLRQERQRIKRDCDPIANYKEKEKELKQFRMKCRKFFANGGKGNQHDIPYFEFIYLSYHEQCALLEEVGILDLMLSRI